MPQKHVTIKDIARESGYSIATVSRVLNGVNMYYNEKTREKVENTAKKLNYIPNYNAKGLKGSSLKRIVYLVPHMDDYYVQLLNVMQKNATSKGYSLLVLNSDYSKKQEEIHIRHILEMRYDGVIIATGLLNKIDIKSTFQEIPVVFLEHNENEEKIPTVAVDVKSPCTEAVDFLVKSGHRKIAFASAPLDFNTLTERFEGYKAGLQKNGLPYDESLIFFDRVLESTDFAVCHRFMEKIFDNRDFSAILIMSDWAAAAAIKIMNDKGFSIPVIGFDNLPFAEYLSPSLSTIDQNSEELGTQGIKMMLDILDGKTVKNKYLKGKLILRSSTGGKYE